MRITWSPSAPTGKTSAFTFDGLISQVTANGQTVPPGNVAGDPITLEWSGPAAEAVETMAPSNAMAKKNDDAKARTGLGTTLALPPRRTVGDAGSAPGRPPAWDAAPRSSLAAWGASSQLVLTWCLLSPP